MVRHVIDAMIAEFEEGENVAIGIWHLRGEEANGEGGRESYHEKAPVGTSQVGAGIPTCRLCEGETKEWRRRL